MSNPSGATLRAILAEARDNIDRSTWVRCPACQHKIPPEYDPNTCIFGQHPKKE